MGFRRAAEILHAAMIAERSIRDLDTVIFPYAACWRHHVELQLKSLLAQLRALSDLPAEGRHHHRIDQLWQEARKPMIEHFPSEKADLASVGNVINQLAGWIQTARRSDTRQHETAARHFPAATKSTSSRSTRR